MTACRARFPYTIPEQAHELQSIARVSLPRFFKLKLLFLLLILIAVAAWFALREMHSSQFQAKYFSEIARDLKFAPGAGPSPSIRFPKTGPYDERLGYSRIGEFTELLGKRDFVVAEQARMSPALLHLGLPPIYREKDQAGLRLLDRAQQPLYAPRSPGRVYAGFDAIPTVLIESLLFIEDRELLDARYPKRNPAVNWSRLSRAVVDHAVQVVIPSHDSPGASTLITQIEKYRHSPDGRTVSANDKLEQMKAASIRAYLGGEDNLDSRRQAVLAYLNTVPLTAKAGYGEINGLGDGMWAWYGRDFTEINGLFKDARTVVDPATLARTAEAYKQALSLMIAQRRPSYYLREGTPALLELTNQHLRLLAGAGIISPALLKATLPLKLQLNQGVVNEPASSFIARKAINALRVELSSMLRVPQLYDLDRYDLTAQTTLDGPAQLAITTALRQLKTTAGAKAAGLYGHNLLSSGDVPERLTFSFTLFERAADANLLRVQTDNLDQPFDINSGARLNLGSTAKLRTLITYLQVISKLHQEYAAIDADSLRKTNIDKRDVLARWVRDWCVDNRGGGLPEILEAAMLRTYSGNPGERFFTGGGLQQFENFEPSENSRIMTVRESFQHSVNLVFVRLMRDIVRHYGTTGSNEGLQDLAKTVSPPADAVAADPDQRAKAQRQAVLARFADKEGREFLVRFYKKYAGKSADEAQQMLIDALGVTPKRLTIVFRSLHPDAPVDQLGAFLRGRLPNVAFAPATVQRLYDGFDPATISLNDRGYLAGVHPLELWLVGYLAQHPGATMTQAADASRDERQQVYGWLFKTRNSRTQESRIHQMLEFDAFAQIARDWRLLGYPFQALTPSYATALGASGDRPASLAYLMGIIVNQGVAMPGNDLQSLQFAAGTPYETRFVHQPGHGQRVIPAEVAEVVRRSLVDVVDGGTAVRLKGGFKRTDGSIIDIGGKTGTGDQRFETYGRGGRLIESRAVNRSATFVFLIGDRFFGTITAYVHEPYAADFSFTSALTVQLLKSVMPALQQLVKQRDKELPLKSSPMMIQSAPVIGKLAGN
jgi:membrane peptidoglycan carboxypeptidase